MESGREYRWSLKNCEVTDHLLSEIIIKPWFWKMVGAAGEVGGWQIATVTRGLGVPTPRRGWVLLVGV